MILPTEFTEIDPHFGSRKTIIYGKGKVGKTSFCVDIPDVMFGLTERGTEYLQVKHVMLNSWDDVLQMCKLLCNDDHKFKTVVLDIADKLFVYCADWICRQEGVKKLSSIAHGAGYAMVRLEFDRVFNKLNIEANIGLIFIFHEKLIEIKKATDAYTYTSLFLSAGYSDYVSGFVDHIFYFYINDEQERFMRTKSTKYINAGDRSGLLPALMPLDYKEFISEYDKAIKQLKGDNDE